MKRLFRVFLLFALFSSGFLSFPSYSSSQEVEAWTNLGLYGGQIYDIAIDPSNPDKMFAGAYMGDGLFMTTDGGSSWQAVIAPEEIPGEDTFKNHAVWAVKIAPSDNNVIWAAHNYWVGKSTDGGKTWTHIWNGWMQSPNYGTCPNCPQWDQFRWCRSLAIDPDDPQTVYVGTSGRYTNYEPCGAIYKTEDGGETWTKMNGPVDACWPGSGNFDYEVVDLAIDGSDPDVIIVWAVTSNGGTIADGTLYRGEINRLTGEDTWAEIFSMDGGKFYDVEIKPNDPNSIFTANYLGIFRHYFEGGSWNYQWILNLSQDPPLPGEVFARNVRALAFDPKNPDILYAAWKNSYSQWGDIDTDSKVARGTPPYEDANWEIYTVDYQFLTLEVHPANSELVFGGELVRGVYKSQDHGQNWTAINNGINALIIYDVDVDPNDPTHLLAATIAGVYEKRDTGDWINTSDFEYTTARSVAFDPTDTDGSIYYAGTQNYLAKTTNSGADWTLSDELPNDYVTDIAIGPNGNIVFITTFKAGGSAGTSGVYRTENGLATPTLTRVLSSDQTDFNVVTIDPNDPEHILAGSGNYYGTKVLGNLHESMDGGDLGTWQLTGLTNVIVNGVLIDPRDSNIMYAGCGYSGGTNTPLYKSTDGGVTWFESFDGIPYVNTHLIGVWGTSESDVFVVGDYGTVLHYDGTSWTTMRTGIQNRLYYVWGTSGTDVFAVGADGTILHYDGSEWTQMDSGTTEYLRGVWGSSSSNVFVAGNAGTVLRYNGSTWNEIDISSLTTEHLSSVWGSSSTDVFASGYSGTILHYDGSEWTAMDSGTTEMVLGLWGTSGTDVFAVGGNGIILHYDGNDWTAITSPTTQELQCVWGTSGMDVYAVGANGTILHYNGSSWAAMASGTDEYMWRVWGSSGTDVFAVGDFHQLLHYDGNSWTNMRPNSKAWNSVTDLEFHPENKNVVYASTSNQGVYVSPNQAEKWLNLGTPEYTVNAISAGSLYAATQSGLLQCTGTGVIAGRVTDQTTGIGIDNATVITDFGVTCRSIIGDYMMVSPSGIFDVTTIADGHANTTIKNVMVLGGDVTFPRDAVMPLGVPDWSVLGGGGTGRGGGGGGCFIATSAVDLIWPNTLRFFVHSQMIPFYDMRSAKDWLPDIAGRKNPSECTWIPINGQKVQGGVLNLGKSSPAGVVTDKGPMPGGGARKTVK